MQKQVSGNTPYLISVGVSANDDGLDPARHQAGDVLADDGLPEHRASQDVTDGAVRRTPHLLKLELLHAILIWRDGGALDAHVVTPDCLCRLNRHPVVCCISVLHTEVIALQEETKRIDFILKSTGDKASIMSWKCVDYTCVITIPKLQITKAKQRFLI